ncbi:TRAP transporter small permease [Bacillus sp. B15-48]|uniref:TRAP transporter small permease n=1 Tax=Bacillus sp. B15-48 TaxID=1548601 RepID=UPI00193F4F32|nr:TRAP transporter small permease [Bacillus sp. B15-48]MBM4761877.1 TRAP transporter small permease subunit [Bacillus sp. B15-48]
MKLIHIISDGIYKLEKLAAIVLCLIILISLSAGVIYRYFLSSPLTWSDETAIFSLIWLTFIGGSMSIKRQNAPAITIIYDRLHGMARKIFLIFSTIAVFVFVAYILYLSINWLSSPNISVQKSSSMQMPMIYAYLSVPVSFLLMTIHSLDVIIKNLRLKKEGIF